MRGTRGVRPRDDARTTRPGLAIDQDSIEALSANVSQFGLSNVLDGHVVSEEAGTDTE